MPTTEQSLRSRLSKAETADEVAEICRLGAEASGGPFWCQTCGLEYFTAPVSRELSARG